MSDIQAIYIIEFKDQSIEQPLTERQKVYKEISSKEILPLSTFYTTILLNDNMLLINSFIKFINDNFYNVYAITKISQESGTVILIPYNRKGSEGLYGLESNYRNFYLNLNVFRKCHSHIF
jgi:hypothetical protein